MSKTKIDVVHISKLANLPLTNEEKNKFEKQLDETISYIKQLEEINTTSTKPTSQVTGLENVTREDIATKSLTQEQALSNTKSKQNNLFKVNVLIDND